MSCNPDKLVELARGMLPTEEANELERHAGVCDACGEELAWLRAEGALFRGRRGNPLPSHTWQGIERRIAVDTERRAVRRRVWVSRGAIAAFAAAAAGILWLAAAGNLFHKRGAERGANEPDKASEPSRAASSAPTTPKLEETSQVLDQAEMQYRLAIQTLEVEWRGERARLDPEEAERREAALVPLREAVEEAGTVPAADLRARQRALRAYSAYMRTMQAVVLEGERP